LSQGPYQGNDPPDDRPTEQDVQTSDGGPVALVPAKVSREQVGDRTEYEHRHALQYLVSRHAFIPLLYLLLSRVLQSSIRHSLNELQDIQRLVAERIKKIRKARGLTQDQLAERAGLNRTHLYRLESGRQSMTLRTLKTIADALDVRVRELVKDL
jgi:DNA-binding XRE family transcriptional regulator